MKRILLAGIILTGSFVSKAQFNFGVKGGLNFTDQFRKDAGKTAANTNLHAELHAGLIADLQLNTNLHIQPQLLYSRKGATHKSHTIPDTKVKMNYVELPLNLVYKVETVFGKVFLGAGPVFSYGFGGELVQAGETKKLYSGIKNFKREDISANVVGGIELNNGMFASLNYQRGFTDIYKTEAVDIKNRSVALSIGYFINYKSRTLGR